MSKFDMRVSYLINLLYYSAGGGWAGTHGFIDPTTGIAVVFGIQMVPSNNVDLVKNWTRLEELVYSAVDPGAGKL
jgi:CubicO group peptidase (beta-lactamase class C family)